MELNLFLFLNAVQYGFVSSSHEGCVCVVNIKVILKIPFFPLEMIALALLNHFSEETTIV